MRFMSAAFIVFILFGTHSLASTGDVCTDKAGNTYSDPTLCALNDLKKTDDELNALYKKILSEHAEDSQFVEKFKNAQRAWLKFRDAEIEAHFPHGTEDEFYYGHTFLFICNKTWLTVLTQERIVQLKKWSKKTEDDEICPSFLPKVGVQK